MEDTIFQLNNNDQFLDKSKIKCRENPPTPKKDQQEKRTETSQNKNVNGYDFVFLMTVKHVQNAVKTQFNRKKAAKIVCTMYLGKRT